MIGLIVGGILLAFVSGAGLYMYSSGKTAGRAACVAELKAADDQLAAAAAKVEQEAATKIIDLAKAHADGEAKAKTRVVYRTKQGADDVAKYPVFANATCVLPPESLKNLNAARAGLRSEPPADVVTLPVAPPVPTVNTRPTPSVVPTAPSERRPFGKRPP